MRGVGLTPDADYGSTIPLQTFMVYQLMFAIITPALITGAFAERMKFSAMASFLVLWSIFVFSPMAHMVWGKGGLLNAGLGGAIPTLGEFAGIPPTGKHVSSDLMIFYRVRDGLIVEHWLQMDMKDIVEQLSR